MPNTVKGLTKTRIAPTPSGYLHIGNLYSFALTYLISKKLQTKLLLKIDDIDTTRTRDEFIEDIFFTLSWAQISFDEGPSQINEYKQNYSSTRRHHLYLKFIQKIEEDFDCYYCACSRKDISSRTSESYDGFCRNRNLKPTSTQNMSLRINTNNCDSQFISVFNTKVAGQFKSLQDFVLLKKEGTASYQLACVVDDIEDKIDFIVRGADLFDSTLAQQFIRSQYKIQPMYWHHPLVYRSGGHSKLSKSQNDVSISSLVRSHQLTPSRFYKWMAKSLDLNFFHVSSLKDLEAEFLNKDISYWQHISAPDAALLTLPLNK